MPSNLSAQALVERAVNLLRSISDPKQPQRSLLIWIETVHEYGFTDACSRLPTLAGKWTDWCVTEAIDIIASDDRWPTDPAKIEVVAEILSERKTKAEIRAIANSKMQPDES